MGVQEAREEFAEKMKIAADRFHTATPEEFVANAVAAGRALDALIEAARAEEREACANACRDEIDENDDVAQRSGAHACLRRIEARGEKDGGS